MAHHKRKRPRTSASGHYSSNAYRHRLGEEDAVRAWYRNHPRWWDKLQHTRPARHRTRALERKVISGYDSDDMIWPTGRKPHVYYW